MKLKLMKALYPGTFDPITFGHIDILERATHLFDQVIVTVAVNKQKKSVFTAEERVDLINEVINEYPWSDKVKVDHFSGLLVDHAHHHHVHTLIRGVRQVSDFEYEFRMALMNRKLGRDIDTVFLMPREELTFVSATMVREVAYWNGDLSAFVPNKVANALKQKYAQINKDDLP
ncbi:MAG: pantetheine-phosphate adenylyltransferase [Balneolales bacterium]